MIKRNLALATAASLCATPVVLAEESAQEADWGIAAVWRTANIPFDTKGSDATVSTFIPMMFFKNDYVFLDGTMQVPTSIKRMIKN